MYFVDSMLQVDNLDAPRRLVPDMLDSFSSTNVFVHVEATRAGAGIGFLPCFRADRHPDLVRLLPEDFREHLPYRMVLRPDSLRQPAVAAVAEALRHRTVVVEGALLGRGRWISENDDGARAGNESPPGHRRRDCELSGLQWSPSPLRIKLCAPER